MTTFLFWNLNRKRLEPTVASLAQRHEVDVVMLAETATDPVVALSDLNDHDSGGFHFPPSQCQKIRIFTRFSSTWLKPVRESRRLTIRRLSLPGQLEVLLAVVHFPSKVNWSAGSQSAECEVLAGDI